MNWEQIMVAFAVNTIDSFLSVALTNPAVAKAMLPTLLRVYVNLQQVLSLSGALPPAMPAPPVPAVKS